MKAHDFLRALNFLGDDTIEEADRMRQPPKKRHTWVKYASLAACAAAIIAAGAVFINQPKIEREPSETTFPTALEDISREPLDFDEEPLDGLDYVLDDDLLPLYTDEASPTPSASNEPSYSELMNTVSDRLRLLEYRIIEPLEPEEAQEFYTENKEIQSGAFTVYRAKAIYDYVADRAVDFEFYISQAGGHLSPTEGMPEYEPGKRLLSAVIFENHACASAVEELRFAIFELSGKNICYHIGAESVKFAPTVRTPECPNIDLEFADGEADRVTTEAKNPEIYTQKSTLESLVSFLISDWQQRGIIAKTRETRLDGSLYTLEYTPEPSRDKVNLIKNSATGEPTSYQMILEEYLGKYTKVYLCEILDILGDSDGGSTLYRAKAVYNILADEEISMEFDLAHAGNSEAQIEGCPGYRKGGKYLLFFNNFDKSRENVALPELEFELFEVMGERILYHILGDNIRFTGDYPNLDLEMSESEKSVVTTTAANPVRYTQKSTFESLCAFIRDSFSEVGYLEKTDNDIKLLRPTLGTASLGFEGYLARDISEIESPNPKPGAEQIETVPVYENPIKWEYDYIPSGQDYQKMEELLLKYAKKFGAYGDGDPYPEIEKSPEEDEIKRGTEKFHDAGELPPDGYFTTRNLAVSGHGVHAEIDVDLLVTVTFDEPFELPEGVDDLKNRDKALKFADYILEKFGPALGMSEPAAHLSGGDCYYSGERSAYDVVIFDEAGEDVDRLLSFGFRSAKFGLDDENRLHIRISNVDMSRKIGDFPIISPDEAMAELAAGRYLTTVTEPFPGVSGIARTELGYYTSGRVEQFLPFYRFLVELPDNVNNLKTFGAFYVPAVREEYIDPHIAFDGALIAQNEPEEQISPAKYFLGKGEFYTPEQVEKIFPNRGTPCLNLSLDGEIPLFKKRLKSPGEADISLMKKKILAIFDDLDIFSPELSEVSEGLVTGYAGGFRVTGDASDGVYKYIIELDDPLDFPEYFDIPYESDDPFEPGFIRRDVGFKADSTVDEIMAAGMFLSEKFPWLFENGSETFASAYGYPPGFIEKNLAVTVVSGFGGLKTFYRYFYAGAVFEGDGEGRLARIIIRDFENSYEPDGTAEALHWGDEEALIRAGEGYPASEDAGEPGDVLYSELVYEADGKAYFKVYCEGGVWYVGG